MYESPIDISYSDMILKTMNEMSKKWNQESDNHVMACVNQFVKVDKDELIRALQYDRGQYEKGYEDGKRDAVKWHEWSEKPERGGSFVVLISNSWSRALNKDVAFYDSLFEEWSIILEGDETPRYWMRLPEPPEWNPEWDKDLLVDVEEENE